MSSIGSMNITLKNNRNLLKNGKRKRFNKAMGGYSKRVGYQIYTLPMVFPHVLRRIRLKIQRENKRQFRLKLIVTVIVLSVFAYLLYQLHF